MSQEETLRLVAAVTDKFSGPIAAMRKSLEGLTSRNVASHKAGRQAALAHERAFQDLRKSVKETGEHVKGILEPAMVGLGIGAISTGAAIAGVTEAIRSFADSSRSLEFARKETGLMIQTLREYEALAPTIGSTPEAMDQGFRKLAGNLDQWRHRLGPLREFFSSRFGEGAGYIRRLGEELVHTTDNAKALSKINALAAMMPKESERRAFYEAMGLDPNLARKKGKELTDALTAIGKRIGELTPADEAKGLAAAESFDRLRESVSKLKTEIGAELSPEMTKATNAIRNFINAHGEDLRKLLHDITHELESANWKKFGDDLRAAAKWIDGTVQSLGGWKVVMEGIIALKFVSVIAPVVTLGLAATRTAASLVAMGATLAGLTAPAWLLALLAGVSAKALIETVRPQPLNKGEDELARQKKYGLDENKGVRAAARAIRKKISAPADDEPHYGRLTPISYGGDTGAASFRKEDTAERAILKGTYEGTRQGVIAAFKEWVESRRQGEGGFTNANYQPGASGGMGGGGGAETPNADRGRPPLTDIARPPAVTTPHAQTPNQGATPRVQAAPTTTPATPAAPRGTTPQARRSEPSEAAAARAMKDFADGGSKAGSLTELINEEARRAGIDPRIMQGIRAGESLHTNKYDKKDDALESSWGPFQLNRRRGTGTEFEKETGLDVRDPSTIPAQVRWVANYLRKKYAKNPHYSPYPNWQGYKRPRDADPRWGESGYRPSKEQAAKREAPKSEGHPAVKSMNEWIEKQRGANPDGAHHIHRPWDGRIGHRQPLSADIGRYIANGGGINSQAHKVTGDASLKISLSGFPKGTKTKSEISGLFKTLTMYRGLAAPMADQEG